MTLVFLVGLPDLESSISAGPHTSDIPMPLHHYTAAGVQALFLLICLMCNNLTSYALWSHSTATLMPHPSLCFCPLTLPPDLLSKPRPPNDLYNFCLNCREAERKYICAIVLRLFDLPNNVMIRIIMNTTGVMITALFFNPCFNVWILMILMAPAKYIISTNKIQLMIQNRSMYK